MSVRERILQAATEAFTAEGLEGLSMRKIAAAVGLTPMALYRHFADKQALIDAITLAALETWRARLAQVQAQTPLEWLDGMGQAFLDFALDSPRLYQAAFQLRANSARRFPDDFAAGRSPPVKLVTDRIEAAQREGLLGPTPAHEIALSLWAMVQGLVELYRAGRFTDEAQFRALYRSAVRRCIASFRPGAPS